jgi:hypothetical protein
MRQLFVMAVFAIATVISQSSLGASCSDTPFNGYNGYCIDGLVPGSYPYFDTSVQVSWKQNKQELTASFDNSPGTSRLFKSDVDYVDITKTKFDFVADITGSSATGSIKITGNIDALNVTGQPVVLMSAMLKGEYGQDGSLIGFNTTGIQCLQAVNDYVGGCTTSEVVYFDLSTAIDLNGGDTTKNGKVKTGGQALTSVPLPAAVWLFGSGLLGLVAIARARKIA